MRVEKFPTPLEVLLNALNVDFKSKGQPTAIRLLVASVVALVGSLLADAVLVRLGVAAFPSIKGFVHFQFSDYAKLTTIGVVIACIGWPLAAWVTSKPRSLFYRSAIIITLVLFLPDLWIWHGGSPARAVFVLMSMHIAIALVTYNALVRLAPIRTRERRP